MNGVSLSTEQVVAMLNFVICMASIWASVCRLNAGSKRTMRFSVRLKYVALISGSTASAFSFAVGQWAGTATALLNTAIFISLAVEMHRWSRGLPDDVKTQPAPLGEPELNSIPGGAKHDP